MFLNSSEGRLCALPYLLVSSVRAPAGDCCVPFGAAVRRKGALGPHGRGAMGTV